jgi:hypothetical protein
LEPNLGKTNHHVHPLSFLVDLFSLSFRLGFSSNANPDLLCVLKFIIFRFRLCTPPLGDFQESTSSIKSHRKGDKKKNKMKKVVYYETNSSSPFTSDAESTIPKRQERKKYSKMPLRYPHILKRAPLLSVPLGKPSYFDGEDYCMWSDKMRHNLTSLHKSIWDIVEFGAQAPQVGDEDYDSDEAAQIRHFNSQATSILVGGLFLNAMS